MYYSTILLKPYETLEGFKTALKRYEKQMMAKYVDIKKMRSKGSKLYQGNPINIRYREAKEGIFNISAEFSRIKRIEDSINKYEIGQTIKHWCTGLEIDGKIVNISKRGDITTEHKPVQWGNQIFTTTFISLNDQGKYKSIIE
jgi:hypothetical protein